MIGVRGSCFQTQLRAVQSDPRPDKIRKVRELGAHQILHVNPLPFVPDQQVLIGGKRPDTLNEASDKVLRLASCGLAGDCLYQTEHVLGAMIDLTRQQVNLLVVSFPLGHILGHADKQTSSIRLGSQRRGNKAPKTVTAVFGADHQLSRLRLRRCRNDPAKMP